MGKKMACFGTSPTGQIEGYGEAVVQIEVPLEKISLNDVFANEAHVRMKTGTIGENTSTSKNSGAGTAAVPKAKT